MRSDIKKLENDLGLDRIDEEGVVDINEVVKSLINGYSKHNIDTTLRKDGGLKYLGLHSNINIQSLTYLRTYSASHFLNIDLIKSKKISCSNWEKEILSSQQLKYAAYVLIN